MRVIKKLEESYDLTGVCHILGQKRLCKRWQSRFDARNYLVSNGLPFNALKSLSAFVHTDLRKEGRVVFGLGEKTISRREKEHKLKFKEASMVFRMAEVVFQAVDAFDDKEKAVRWLNKPCRVLNNEIPLRLLHDDVGRGLVEDVLGQIKYGIYS